MSNTFGRLFKLTTFGESHGKAIGGIVDGCPAGISFSEDFVQKELDRRKPGQSHLTTQRKESDTVQFLSGVFEGKTTGAPIGFMIPNEDQRSKDYSHLKDRFRPSHADFTYEQKYGHRDYRGGGRSSARETASRVAGGAIAQAFLSTLGVTITAWVERVKDVELGYSGQSYDRKEVDASLVRCPDEKASDEMQKLIEHARKNGDTLGGAIRCVISGVPAGWGEPVFGKLHAELGGAMLGINAVKAFEIGSGIEGTTHFGSEQNDAFIMDEGTTKTTSNNSGGIQGGISNGQSIHFSVAFKPVATIMKDQVSVDQEGHEILVKGKGRHDPCVLPRAVAIVEAMAALVLADAALLARTNK